MLHIPLASILEHCSHKRHHASRFLSGFKNLASKKGHLGAIKLGDARFWDDEYSKAENKSTEWYVNSGRAAGFLQEILLQRNILHPSRINVIVEIGCGMSPVVLPLAKRLRECSNLKIVYFATDASTVCIEQLKNKYSDHAASIKNPKLPIFRSDIQNTSPTFLTRGVLASAVDIRNFDELIATLRYFPITDTDSYKSNLSNSNIDHYRTNVVTVDKGCLDAIIWDESEDLVRKVLENSDSVVSISGEDPDIRLDYFQEKYRKLFSLHLLHGLDNIFGYSYVRE